MWSTVPGTPHLIWILLDLVSDSFEKVYIRGDTDFSLTSNFDQWLSSRQDLFVHTKPLEIIFKAKFKDAMQKAGLLDKIDPAVWKQQWVIDSQAVGQGQNSLRYLSRYVFLGCHLQQSYQKH